MPHRHLVDVHVLLVADGQLLLSRRRDTDPHFDGLWHLPAGTLDPGESAPHGAAREAEEEIGVLIRPQDLRHVHTLHATGPGLEPRLGLFFMAERWTGEPHNREPDHCSEVGWFPLTDLPGDVIGYSAAGVRGYRDGRAFGLLGWEPPDRP